MATNIDISRLIACHACDLLIRKPHVLPGNKAVCPRCSTPIYEPRKDTLNRTLALVIAGMILLWPAFLLHYVHPNLADDLRISISFNLIVKSPGDYLPDQ